MDPTLADYLRAIFLGVVQAVTEFLPISSSGHLVLAPRLLGEETSSLTFDIGLHLGTLVAVLVYFWRDWWQITKATAADTLHHGPRLARWGPQSRLGLWLAVGTLPAIVVGVLAQDAVEERFREPAVVAVMLILFSFVIDFGDRRGGSDKRVDGMGVRRSLLIGAAQALALVPGVSRSGATITAARLVGFERPSAARFSFLLSAPVILGAGIFKVADAISGGEQVMWGPLLVGALTSAIVGALVIRGLLRYLVTRTLRVFVWYRIALGLAVLGAVAAGIL
ncbi:MAG: undecaprenyl-diphosphatase UppP [Dehalococcoidia bacterium]|nr:undecaprenyl-diphosphatase UppP [Dehalococcoidia bacterium]